MTSVVGEPDHWEMEVTALDLKSLTRCVKSKEKSLSMYVCASPLSKLSLGNYCIRFHHSYSKVSIYHCITVIIYFYYIYKVHSLYGSAESVWYNRIYHLLQVDCSSEAFSDLHWNLLTSWCSISQDKSLKSSQSTSWLFQQGVGQGSTIELYLRHLLTNWCFKPLTWPYKLNQPGWSLGEKPLMVLGSEMHKL